MSNQSGYKDHYRTEQPTDEGLDETPCSRLLIPRPLLELRIRSAVADKEFVTAMANNDLHRYGEWRCDYSEWSREIVKEIEDLFSSANSQDQP